MQLLVSKWLNLRPHREALGLRGRSPCYSTCIFIRSRSSRPVLDPEAFQVIQSDRLW